MKTKWEKINKILFVYHIALIIVVFILSIIGMVRQKENEELNNIVTKLRDENNQLKWKLSQVNQMICNNVEE